MKSSSILALALLSSLAACTTAIDDPSEDVGVDDLPTVSRTVVRLAPDGTQTVDEDFITPAEQRDEIAARDAQLAQGRGAESAIAVDDGCGGSSLWIYDNVNQTGNEVCFYGAGTAYLSYYRRSVCAGSTCYFGNWMNAVRSYYAGSSGGRFGEVLTGITMVEPFTPWKRANAGVVALHDTWVQLDN